MDKLGKKKLQSCKRKKGPTDDSPLFEEGRGEALGESRSYPSETASGEEAAQLCYIAEVDSPPEFRQRSSSHPIVRRYEITPGAVILPRPSLSPTPEWWPSWRTTGLTRIKLSS